MAECKLTVALLAQGRGLSVVDASFPTKGNPDEGRHQTIDATRLLSPRRDGKSLTGSNSGARSTPIGS